MKTEELLKLLSEEYPSPNWAFIPEFRGGTGYARETRADALAMHCWPSRGLELIGFELKVSRSDWIHEMKNKGKAEPIKQFCDRWYLVTANSKIVKYAEEMPHDWGLMFVENGKLITMIEAPKLTPRPIDRLFLASLMRRASKQDVIIQSVN